MNLAYLTQHPEQLNKDTLHELRAAVAAQPTHQVARLLMLQNLYLLHDPTFDEEMRRASVFITDRNVIFNMVEAVHHTVGKAKKKSPTATTSAPTPQQPSTAALATTDYTAYMLAQQAESNPVTANEHTTRQQQLIDSFISSTEQGQPVTTPTATQTEKTPDTHTTPTEDNAEQGGFFTETLARIYLQQGRYDKALQIIKQLNLNYPEKSRYFADQIRFLEKAILSQQTK
ncbi:MAG: tetratricopeptide repeat protein [Bacteroidaceae bacterium]|nr:tetratricopeptide repeat protein [Bacteroidaceae bacterium]